MINSGSLIRVPMAFIWRRLHSLTGLWLTAYLALHLFTNSQAALFVGDSGSGFVKAVNDIRSLPYLPVLEIILLAIPFAVHMYWGVLYALTGKFDSFRTDGNAPSLPEYPRNHAYTWQRITSWILLVLITLHVIQMRFMESPATAAKGTEKYFIVRVNSDLGLFTLAPRLGYKLFGTDQVVKEQESLKTQESSLSGGAAPDTPEGLVLAQEVEQQRQWVKALEQRPLEPGQLLVVANNFGTAELMMVRETFKMPAMLFLYTVFVLSACFHGYNGLWTFMISWGATLSVASQRLMRVITNAIMFLIAFLGLAAIWGTYWINLRY